MNPSPRRASPGDRSVAFPGDAVKHALEHPLLRALVPTGVGIRTSADGRGFESAQGIAPAIFIYCAKGCGWCEMGGVRHEIRAGQLLVIPPFTPHVFGVEAKDPLTAPWVHVTGENLSPLLLELGVTALSPLIDLGDDPQVLAFFDEAVTAAESSKTFTTTTMFYASQSVTHLLALINKRRRQFAAKPLEMKERIGRAVEFMKRNLGETVQLDRIAAVANMSVSSFCSHFREETGCAPMEYRAKLRIERARQLLDTTDLPIKEIAGEIGYADPLYFSRTFRLMLGVSPTEYREAREREAKTTAQPPSK